MNKLKSLATIKNYKMLLVLFGLSIAISLISPSFISFNNIVNMLRQSSVNAVISFGMAFVIISGGIDLSVGSILAISSAFAMSVLSISGNGVLAVLLALLAGVLAGLSSGFLIAKAKLQPFIITLVMMNFLRGATLVFTDGRPITIKFEDINPFYDFIGNGKLYGIPIPILIMFVLFGLSYYILYHTKMGRYIYAIGGNEEASKLSGVNIVKVKLFIYSYCGFLAAVAGIIISSRLSSAQPTSGVGYELDAIAAVVVGGTSLAGGIGTLGNTLVGALIIGVLNNALNLLQVSSYYQTIVKALVILGAVLLNMRSKN